MSIESGYAAMYKCPICGYATTSTNRCRTGNSKIHPTYAVNMYATGWCFKFNPNGANWRRHLLKGEHEYETALSWNYNIAASDKQDHREVPSWAWFGWDVAGSYPKTKAIGECYTFAFKKALKSIVDGTADKTVIIHATVKDVWDKHPYSHAWVEVDGVVYDWQTMEAGSSKYAGEGWPRDDFYKAYTPYNIKKYTPKQTSQLSNEKGHTGPW
jgi:hypothetical protein